MAGRDIAAHGLGSNGYGKSTFLKCVVGLNRPTRGTIEVAGRNLADLSGELFGAPCGA
ncbi:ATP-binding cassette domain-containing protein [Burkholderia sp. BDU5]|uniref:ATP-binding cassette domain-containing protein n=1 Tax=Burkholderia sp. BDU5 TaxID=1385590 RepID=UPI000A5A0373|nr:ATP-binding cassette domain-containing protein [Burkholderia sp. BDU5]